MSYFQLPQACQKSTVFCRKMEWHATQITLIPTMKSHITLPLFVKGSLAIESI